MSMASQYDVLELLLQIGHEAYPKNVIGEDGFTHEWKLYVRGLDNDCLHHCVDKVIFYLHESFAKPKRVVKEPPFQVKESGYAGFELQIEVYFKNKEEPKMILLDYDLIIEVNKPVEKVKREKLTFQNPNPDFKKKLLKGGAVLRNDSKRAPLPPAVAAAVAAAANAANSAHLDPKCDLPFSATNINGGGLGIGNGKSNTTSSSVDCFSSSSLSSPAANSVPSPAASAPKKASDKSKSSSSTSRKRAEKTPKTAKAPGKGASSGSGTASASFSSTQNNGATLLYSGSVGTPQPTVSSIQAAQDSQFTDLFGPPLQSGSNKSTPQHDPPTPTQLAVASPLAATTSSAKSKNSAKLSSKSSTGSKSSAKVAAAAAAAAAVAVAAATADKADFNAYYNQQYEQQYKSTSPNGSASTTFSASIRTSASSKSEQSMRASKVSSKTHERSDSACSSRSASKEVRREKISHKEALSCKSKQNVDLSSGGKKEKDNSKKSKSGDKERDRSRSAATAPSAERLSKDKKSSSSRKRKKQASSSSESSSSSSSDSSDSEVSGAEDYKFKAKVAKRKRLNSASSTSSQPAAHLNNHHVGGTVAGSGQHPTSGAARAIMYGKDDTANPFVSGDRSKQKLYNDTVGGGHFPGLLNNRIPKLKRETSESPVPNVTSPQFSDEDKVRSSSASEQSVINKKESSKKNSKASKDIRNNSSGTETSQLLSTKIKYQDEKSTTTISIKEINKKKVWDNTNETKSIKNLKESSKSSSKVSGSSKIGRNRERSSSVESNSNEKNPKKSKSGSKYADDDVRSKNKSRDRSVDATSKSKKKRDLSPSSAMLLVDKKTITPAKYSDAVSTHSQHHHGSSTYVQEFSNKLAQNVALTAEQHHAAHFRRGKGQRGAQSDDEDDDKMSVSSASSNSSRSSSSLSSHSSASIPLPKHSGSKTSKSKERSKHKSKERSDGSKRKHSKKNKKFENNKWTADSESEHEEPDQESKFVAKRASSDSEDDNPSSKHSKRPESGARNSINGTVSKRPNGGGFTGLSDSDSEMSDNALTNSVIKSPLETKHSKTSSKKSKKHSKKHSYPESFYSDSDMSVRDTNNGDSREVSAVASGTHPQSLSVHDKKRNHLNSSPHLGAGYSKAQFGPVTSPIDRAALSSGYGTDRLSVSPAQGVLTNGFVGSPALKHSSTSTSVDYSELQNKLIRLSDSKKLQKVIDLIDDRNFECLQVVGNRIEFDLKKLDQLTLVEIRRVVC